MSLSTACRDYFPRRGLRLFAAKQPLNLHTPPPALGDSTLLSIYPSILSPFPPPPLFPVPLAQMEFLFRRLT